MCSPPSKMLADLEQKWGMTLLERSKSGVRLTSAGEPVRPFLLLEHSGKAEVSDLLERAHVQSDIHFTAWGDFAITAMVERSLAVSILPGLILQRIPYKIEIAPAAALLPPNRPCYEEAGPPNTRRAEVHRILPSQEVAK